MVTKPECIWRRSRNSGSVFTSNSFDEIVLSSLCEQDLFVTRAGPEVIGQMYAFKDKGDRDICLIPEGTAVIQREYENSWKKSRAKPIRLFYVARCYRYEKPQALRYREFTQFGVEILGGTVPHDAAELNSVLEECLSKFKVDVRYDAAVKRGLTYYTEPGFEVVCEGLGAQKQIAGGGRYEGGIGFAIGVERLIGAMSV